MPSTALPVQYLLLSQFHSAYHHTLLHPDRHQLFTRTLAVTKAALKLANNWPRLQPSMKISAQCKVVYSTITAEKLYSRQASSYHHLRVFSVKAGRVSWFDPDLLLAAACGSLLHTRQVVLQLVYSL